MDYNWKYVKIRSSRALRIWQDWPSYAKIKFLELLREDFSNELRLFSCWCIEKIVGKDYLENDKNDAINITRKVIQKRMSFKRLLATKGRYRTPFDYDILKINNGADIRRGPDQMNIAWLRIMNRLCDKNAYDIATSITWLLEDYRVQSHLTTPSGNGQGYGWDIVINPLRFIGHMGDASGFMCVIARMKDDKNTIIVLSNVHETNLRVLVKELYDILYST